MARAIDLTGVPPPPEPEPDPERPATRGPVRVQQDPPLTNIFDRMLTLISGPMFGEVPTYTNGYIVGDSTNDGPAGLTATGLDPTGLIAQGDVNGSAPFPFVASGEVAIEPATGRQTVRIDGRLYCMDDDGTYRPL